MALRIAINGFGRIGRSLFRLWLQQIASLQSEAGRGEIEIVALNDVADWKTLTYLLEFDSTHGRCRHAVCYEPERKGLIVGARFIPIFQEQDPTFLPWRDLDVDVVVESSRKFRTRKALSLHLTSGAKKVLLACPGEEPLDYLAVYGINHIALNDAHQLISAASCTVNALAVAIKPIRALEIETLSFTEIHAVTADQKMVDCAHSEIRRSRAGGVNMIPTPTRATRLIGDVFPELKENVQGYSLRVPVLNVACLDLTFVCKNTVQIASVHALYRMASLGDLSTVLAFNQSPLVSGDFIGHSASAVYDATQTSAIGRTLKIIVWYDNEWGYASRLLDLLFFMRT